MSTKIKKYLLSIIISLFLLAGLYLNYELDKDFLSQFGFTGFFVIVSIVFFIGIKIISEFLFFRLTGLKKWLVGSFALFVVIGSIISIFFVRIYKSESMFQSKMNINQTIDSKNRVAAQNRLLLINQVKSIEKQIKLKTSMINDLNDSRWLKYRYAKDIGKLNTQKLVLIKDIRSLKTNEIPVTKKTTSLHSALNIALGYDSKNLTLGVNLLFTIFVDTALILLCFGLSYILGSSPVKLINEPHNKPVKDFSRAGKMISPLLNQNVVIRKHSINRDKPVNDRSERQVNLVNLVDKLKKALDSSSLTQDQFAREKLGISKVSLWKILNGKTKTISQPVQERILAI